MLRHRMSNPDRMVAGCPAARLSLLPVSTPLAKRRSFALPSGGNQMVGFGQLDMIEVK
jgi:hypothetical protein